MQYFKKYDEQCGGIQYVFDRFYNILEEKKIKGNIVACPGKDIDRYIKYFGQVKGRGKWKGTFFELDEKLFNKMDLATLHTDLNIKALRSNILVYEDDPDYESKRSAPIEDLGIGSGMVNLMAYINAKLHRQDRRTLANRKKVQIVNSCLRNVSYKNAIKGYKDYLKVIGVELKRINGIPVNLEDGEYCLSKEFATRVYSYPDMLLKKDVHVYKHEVELKDNDREAELFIHTYINGSTMMQSMLIYK